MAKIVTIDGIPVYQALVDSEDTGMLRISLVDDPAVQSDFLAFKAQAPGKQMMTYSVQDEEKRLVLGVVMRADFPIYRRDKDGFEYYIIYKAETIRAMAEKYLAENRQNEVNTMHQDGSDVEDVQMVQFFIKDTAKGVAPEAFADCADGTLLAEFHVTNDEVWDAIKAGTYKGFSLEGVFNLAPEHDGEDVQRIVETLEGKFSTILKNTKMAKLKGLLARLAKAIVNLGNITTDKGVLSWDGDDDLKAGDAVYIEDAEVAPAEPAEEPKEEPAKMLETDKGKLEWDNEDEDLKAGDEVFITDEDGNRNPAPDGEYTTEDGKVISVVDGKVASITDPKAEVAAQKEQKMGRIHRIVAAFSESYDEKFRKIANAIAEKGFMDFYIEDAGDDFAVICNWNEEGECNYLRFAVSWDEEGNAVVSDPVEVVPAFVTPEERDAADAEFARVKTEKENLAQQVADLTAQVETFKRTPAGKPAHEEFNAGGEVGKTGNKGLDNIARLMGAK